MEREILGYNYLNLANELVDEQADLNVPNINLSSDYIENLPTLQTDMDECKKKFPNNYNAYKTCIYKKKEARQIQLAGSVSGSKSDDKTASNGGSKMYIYFLGGLAVVAVIAAIIFSSKGVSKNKVA